MLLTKEQIARYSRQLILPEVGASGQKRLNQASVVIIGAGGLGSPAALYLAAAGVGRLGIIDSDRVVLSNLHRQILHETSNLDELKSTSAQRRLKALNPEIVVEAISHRIGASNAEALLEPYDVVLDGSDNFATRYLVNDACVLKGKTLIHGGVVHYGGQLITIVPRESACFRCIFPEAPQPGAVPSCQEAGILGAVAGVIGSLMAYEVLKVLLGLGEPLMNRLLVYEGLKAHFRSVPVRRDIHCAVCGNTPTIHSLSMKKEPALCRI